MDLDDEMPPRLFAGANALATRIEDNTQDSALSQAQEADDDEEMLPRLFGSGGAPMSQARDANIAQDDDVELLPQLKANDREMAPQLAAAAAPHNVVPLTAAEYTLSSRFAARIVEHALASGGSGAASSILSPGALAIVSRAKYVMAIEASQRGESVPRTIRDTPFAQAHYLNAIMGAIDASRPRRLTAEGAAAMRRRCFASPREHEDAQLFAAEPPLMACARGGECEAHRLECGAPTAGVMAYHTTIEWARYTSERAQRGPEARVARYDALEFGGACLVCVRADALEAIMSQRALRVTPAAPGTDDVAAPYLAARLINPVDVAGGYRAVDCMGPRESVVEGLAGPIVRHNVFAYCRERDAATGRERLRQTYAYPVPPTRDEVAREFAHASALPSPPVAAGERTTTGF